MDFEQFSTVGLIAHMHEQANLSARETVLLDRLESALEEIDLLVADIDRKERELITLGVTDDDA